MQGNVMKAVLFAAVSAAVLMSGAARASVSGATASENYASNPLANWTGVDSSVHEPSMGGKITLQFGVHGVGLSQYLIPGTTDNEISVTAGVNPVAVYWSDGTNRTPAVPPLLSLTAFLAPDHESIDWADGWSLTIGWNPIAGSNKFENLFVSENPNASLGLGGTLDDSTTTRNSAGVIIGSAFNTTAGVWTDPVASGSDPNWKTSAIPEPSTWAMMLLGFCGLGFLGRKARRERLAKI